MYVNKSTLQDGVVPIEEYFDLLLYLRNFSPETNLLKMASLCGRLLTNIARRRAMVSSMASTIQYRHKSTSK